MQVPREMTPNQALAIAAGLLGVLALVAGSPYRAHRAQVDAVGLTAEIEAGSDHVGALELAAWIKDRRADLRVLDLRDSAAFSEYSIPTAERLALRELPNARFARYTTLVLYGADGTHAAQAWVLLRALGHERALVLREGLGEWVRDVLNASLPADATPEERAAFREAAALSRYFGGQPRIGVTRDAPQRFSLPGVEAGPPETETGVRQARRRGCAL